MIVSSTTGDIKKSALPLDTPLPIIHKFEVPKATNDKSNLMPVLFMISPQIVICHSKLSYRN